jgi:hypothetical protein
MQRAFLFAASVFALLLVGFLVSRSSDTSPGIAEPQPARAVRPEPDPPVRGDTSAERAAVAIAPVVPREIYETTSAAPGATFTVRVQDPGGEPVHGALVQLAGPSMRAGGSTGPDGACSMPRPPAGSTIQLSVTDEGCFPVHLERSFWQDLTVTVHPLGALSGIVRDRESGAPIRGARVVAMQAKRDAEAARVTDEGGRFEGLSVPVGCTFVLTLEASEYLPSAQTLVIRPEVASIPHETFLERAWAVRFNVLDLDSGEPLADASINGFRSNYEADEQGVILVDQLLRRGAAVHDIAVSAPGHCEVRFELRDLDQVETAAIPLRLPRSSWIEGVLLDAEGVPAVGLRVTAETSMSEVETISSELLVVPQVDGAVAQAEIDLSSVWHQSADTDEQGRFEFDGYLPDSHSVRLEVRREGQLVARRVLERLGPPGRVHRVEIRLQEPSGANVRGQLLLHGKPVAGSVLWQGPTLDGRIDVGPDGIWSATDVELGLVTFSGSVRARGHLLSEQDRAERQLLVEREARLECVLALEPTSALIGGRVVGPSGEPLSGAEILIQSEDRSTKTESGEQGHWSAEVPPAVGSLRVKALLATREGERVAHAGDLRIDFHVAATATLRYRAVDCADGAVVKSPWLHRRVGPDRFEHVGLPGRDAPDSKGWRQIELPEGDHEFLVTLPGGMYQTCSRTVRLIAGTTTELNFELEPAHRLKLRLAEGIVPPQGHWVALLHESEWHQFQPELDGEDVSWTWTGTVQDPTANRRVLRLESLSRTDIGGLAPGRYGLKLFPGDGILEPPWIDVPAPSGFVEVRWIER